MTTAESRSVISLVIDGGDDQSVAALPILVQPAYVTHRHTNTHTISFDHLQSSTHSFTFLLRIVSCCVCGRAGGRWTTIWLSQPTSSCLLRERNTTRKFISILLAVAWQNSSTCLIRQVNFNWLTESTRYSTMFFLSFRFPFSLCLVSVNFVLVEFWNCCSRPQSTPPPIFTSSTL